MTDLLLILVGMPLFATIVGWLFAGTSSLPASPDSRWNEGFFRGSSAARVVRSWTSPVWPFLHLFLRRSGVRFSPQLYYRLRTVGMRA